MNDDQNHFNKGGILSDTLRQAWHFMTGIHTLSSETGQPLQGAEDAAKSVQIIESWNERGEVSTEHLPNLLDDKKAVVTSFRNLRAWPDLYLSQPPVQVYLRAVMKSVQMSRSQEDIEYTKLLMRQLVKPSDSCLVKELTDVSDWLFHTEITQPIVALECTDMAALQAILETYLREMDLAKAESSSLYGESPAQQVIKVQATAVVANAVNYLCDSFRKADQKYEGLFLVTVLVPCHYDVTDKMFQKLLSNSALKYLRIELEEQSKEFSHNSQTKVQAYLFHLTVKMYQREDVDVTETQVKCHLEYLRKQLKGDIDPQVSCVLDQFGSSEGGLEELRH